MAEPLDPGGNFLFTANAIASAADQNYQGAMVFRTIFGLLCGRLFTNPVEVTGPLDGFFGEDCLVEHVSAMNVRVKPGFGLQVVTPADNYSPSFQPVVVESNTTQAISTADATHPRIDVIAIKASTTDTESASRNTYGGGSSMVNTVRKPSALISYTAGTPAAVVTKLHQAYSTALADPAVQARLKQMGSNASALTPAQFAEMVVQERDKYQELVKLSGAKVD